MEAARDTQPAPHARGGASPHLADEVPLRSLQDDVEALIDDGKTYFQAELAFQKSRALFVAEEAKIALVLGIAGALLALLTLIGLTVGLIIALAQHIGPWWAAAIVVSLLALGTFLLLRAAQRRWIRLISAFQDSGGAQ